MLSVRMIALSYPEESTLANAAHQGHRSTGRIWKTTRRGVPWLLIKILDLSAHISLTVPMTIDLVAKLWSVGLSHV